MTKLPFNKLALKKRARDQVETGLHVNGFKLISDLDEEEEGYPTTLAEIGREGYPVQIFEGLSWREEWKYWVEHFRIQDPDNVSKLTMYYDKTLRILYLLNAEYLTGRRFYVN